MLIEKVWGSEYVVANTADYCGKRMVLKKGWRCSLHYHPVKREHFFVESGRMRLRFGPDDSATESVVLGPGDSFFVPTGLRHQFTGLEDTVFFEFSTRHDDADVVRIEPSGPVEEGGCS